MINCGFDIGVKNLAFCVIDTEQYKKYDKTNTGILEWVCIDIIKNPMCNGLIKSGKNKDKECGKNANFTLDDKFFCGTHKLEKCKKYKIKNSKNQTAEELLRLVFLELDNYKDIFSKVNNIVIEQQPKFNPKMKVISCGIQSYFILRYKIDIENPQLKSVKYSSAKNKMKVYKGPNITSPKKTRYEKLKDLAQKHTEHILEDTEDLNKYYLSHPKKKDDLADSFLHCVFSIK